MVADQDLSMNNPAPVKLGVCGLGRAFSLMLPTFSRDDRFHLVAAATPGAAGRRAFERDFSGRAYPSMEQLCEDDEVEAIYIASPHQFHCQHVEMAAAAGKHCLLEKPMAINLAEAGRIVDAVERAAIKLVVGPSHSFDAPVGRARSVIHSGQIGDLKQVQAMNYTDFLYRPRRPEELDTTSGGGVVFSQGIHQVDIVRMLAGGMAQSVYAATGNWDPERPTEGAYSAMLQFENGTFAALTYNGYGHFDGDRLMHDYSELGFSKKPADYGGVRARLAVDGARDESDLKRQRNLGFADTAQLQNKQPQSHEHFGLIIASCEGGDLRLFPDGIEIHADGERQFELLPPPSIPRREVMDEFYQAVTGDKPVPHSARWGMASLEVVLGVLESARHNRVVPLEHQVPFNP